MKIIERDDYGNLTGKSVAKMMGLGLIGVALLVFLIGSIYTVKTGEVGIVTRFGKVSRTAKEGINFKVPGIENVTKIEIRDRVQSGKYNVSSEDGIRLVNPRMAEVVQAITSNYTIEELVAKRQQLGQDIYKNLREDLLPFGIEVIKVSIVNHDFSDEFEKAIEKKKVAEQTAQEQEIRNQQALKNAENNLKVKELEAKANSVLTQSLTDNVLRKMYIEKWDGKLPQYQGNGTPIIDLK